MFRKLAVLLICFSAASLGAVEEVAQTIIPIMERYEYLENLPFKKYSHNQYLDIFLALNRIDERLRIVSWQIFSNQKVLQKWEERAPNIATIILNAQPDIIALQGITANQSQLLSELLEVNYGCFGDFEGKGPDANVIFFRKGRFSLQSLDTDPLQGRKKVTALSLMDLYTQKSFTILNTRLTFEDADTREQEVITFCTQIASLQMPTILAGAFHTFPARLDADLPFYDGDYILRLLTKCKVKDAKKVSLLGHLGPLTTSRTYSEPGIFLDHILVTNDIEVLIHAIEPATTGKYPPSDHMPVVVDLIIK